MKKVYPILIVVLALLPVAQTGQAADYLGSHTIVVKGLPAPTQDRGSVICFSDGPSVGGACIPLLTPGRFDPRCG